MSSILTVEEVRDLSGGYKAGAKQLKELHRQGFFRARRSPLTGQIIVERAHYEAVCRGGDSPPSWTPRLKPA